MANEKPNIHDLGSYSGSRRTVTEEHPELMNDQLWIKLEKLGKKISFAKDILALGRYLKDPGVSWHRKAIVAGALVYFVSPVEKVRDLEPLFRKLDELGVIEAVLKYMGSEIIPYYDPDYRA